MKIARSDRAVFYLRIQRPMVGDDVHLGPSGIPPLGQNTDTRVSVGSQLTGPSVWATRMPPVAGSALGATAAGPGGPGDPGGPGGAVRFIIRVVGQFDCGKIVHWKTDGSRR